MTFRRASRVRSGLAWIVTELIMLCIGYYQETGAISSFKVLVYTTLTTDYQAEPVEMDQ
jgi:hypothetical protein